MTLSGKRIEKMSSRRRNSKKNLGNSISDIQRRLRRMERKPIRTRLQNRVIKGAAIAPSSITADEVDFGTTVVTTENPEDVIDNPKEGLLVVDPDTGAGQLYSEEEGGYVDIKDATAQATADGKNTIYAQTTAPSGANLKTNDIWYDTDDGNKLYVWNGTAWVNIQDTAIAAAKDAADAAKLTADGKNSVYRQDAQPAGGTYVAGDIWFDTDDNNKIYRYSGTTWVAVQLGGNALANINANAITAGTIDASAITVSNITASNISTGTLAAARIAANSLDVSVLQAGTLRVGTIYTGDIAASQITAGTITAAISITSPTINGGTINLSTSGSTDRIIMSSSSANRISFYSSSASFPNPGEISNGIESITLNETLVETATLFLRPATTTFGLFASYPYIKMNQSSDGVGSYMEMSANDIQIQLGTGVAPGTMALYQFGSGNTGYSSDSSNGSVSIRNIYFNTAAPTGNDGVPGDVWLQG